MSEAPSTPKLITELQASAHLMLLEAGIYCVHHTPGSMPPDPQTGLPGARLSVPPGAAGHGVSITGFQDDGWLGPLDSAALIRVSRGPAQVLMTIYQAKDSDHEPPRLQVTRLVEGVQATPPTREPVSGPPGVQTAEQVAATLAASEAEVAAHVQLRGDVLARIGDWVGERGSARWLEGFALSPRRAELTPADLEYQAVLGRGWLSPWAEGGQYCGSRGMALPILGLRVRLRGPAALTHTVELSATFTDGSAVGPVGPGDACEAESLAPLEAFRVAFLPLRDAVARRASRARPASPPPPAKFAPARTKAAAKPEVKAPAAKRAAAPVPPIAKRATKSVPAKPAPRKLVPTNAAATKPAPRGRGR